MLQINAHEKINEEYIESIFLYDSAPLRQFASAAEKQDLLRRFPGRFGQRTMIVMEKGKHILAPFLPKTYFQKLDMEKFFIIDPLRYAIKRSSIIEITSKPNAGQRRDIAEMKKKNGFLSFTKGQKTNLYIFTDSGRIYGVHAIRKGGEGC